MHHFPEGGVESAILYKKNIKYANRQNNLSGIINPSSVILRKKKAVEK